jgi:hypothetical protein
VMAGPPGPGRVSSPHRGRSGNAVRANKSVSATMGLFELMVQGPMLGCQMGTHFGLGCATLSWDDNRCQIEHPGERST